MIRRQLHVQETESTWTQRALHGHMSMAAPVTAMWNETDDSDGEHDDAEAEGQPAAEDAE